jgi:hypothetical protein
MRMAFGRPDPVRVKMRGQRSNVARQENGQISAGQSPLHQIDLAVETMCHVRTALQLAQGVGESLGRRKVLFGPLPRPQKLTLNTRSSRRG